MKAYGEKCAPGAFIDLLVCGVLVAVGDHCWCLWCVQYLAPPLALAHHNCGVCVCSIRYGCFTALSLFAFSDLRSI